jgi:hypothetical protein
VEASIIPSEGALKVDTKWCSGDARKAMREFI